MTMSATIIASVPPSIHPRRTTTEPDEGGLSMRLGEAALRIEAAVSKVLESGLRTADIWSEGTQRVGTREMGSAVDAAVKAA